MTAEAERILASAEEKQRRKDRECVPAYEAAGIDLNISYTAGSQDIELMPVPVGFEGDDGNGAAIQTVDPTRSPKVKKLECLDILGDLVFHGKDWAGGDHVRWTALFVLLGKDLRTLQEIADEHRVTRRLVEMRLKEAKDWARELVAELRSSRITQVENMDDETYRDEMTLGISGIVQAFTRWLCNAEKFEPVDRLSAKHALAIVTELSPIIQFADRLKKLTEKRED